MREGVAKDEWRTVYVHMKWNLSDVLTKMITNREDGKRKIRMMLFNIYPEG